MRWRILFLAPLATLVLIPTLRSGVEHPGIAATSATPVAATQPRSAPATAAPPAEEYQLAIARPSYGKTKVARALNKPFSRPAPQAQKAHPATAEPLMVGPDGIVYERIGPESAPEPEPVAWDKPRHWSDVPETPQTAQAEQSRLEPVPAPREERSRPAERVAGGVMVGPDGTVFERAPKSAR